MNVGIRTWRIDDSQNLARVCLENQVPCATLTRSLRKKKYKSEKVS